MKMAGKMSKKDKVLEETFSMAKGKWKKPA